MGVGFKDTVGDGKLDGVEPGVGLTVGVGVFIGVGDGVFVGDGVRVGVCGVGDGVFVKFGGCDTIRDTSGDPAGLVSLVAFGVTDVLGFKLLLSTVFAMFAV